MQCIICYEDNWVTNTDCNHSICISCLFDIQKDECPYCRKQLFFNFPKHLRPLLNIHTYKKSNILDVTDQSQFPSLND
jgi:hypothetical protein